jgi:predicted Zn-dependent peptidase
MQFQTHRLSNGLQIIGETLPSSRSVAVGFFVRTGSRDEQPGEGGVSHFLEHMMFKGTERRTALEVNLDFDRIGANYNAYTSEEQTVYYAAVLPEYLPQAVEILTDILRPTLRTADFDTEKQVILEEIKMYEDQPTSVAWDHAKEVYFRGHPLGNSILGTTAGISALTAAQMRAYFDRRYVNSNILVTVAGNFDWQRFVQLLETATAKWPDSVAPRTGVTPAISPGGMFPLSKADLAQQHLMCLATTAPAESLMRYTATVLSVAIGDDSGSRLHWELVDPGRVESASCAADQCQGSGLLATTLSCDPEQAVENLKVVRRVLGEVQKHGITADELSQAKNKITSRVVRYNERPMGRMRSIATSWQYCDEYHDPDIELGRFDAINQNSVREYLELYPLDALTVVGYGPLEKLV